MLLTKFAVRQRLETIVVEPVMPTIMVTKIKNHFETLKLHFLVPNKAAIAYNSKSEFDEIPIPIHIEATTPIIDPIK